jgi:hypothetical protein
MAQFMALAERHAEAEERKDYRTAQISWLLAEINRDHGKRSRPFEIEDFMPLSGRREISEEELDKKLDAVMMGLGGIKEKK